MMKGGRREENAVFFERKFPPIRWKSDFAILIAKGRAAGKRDGASARYVKGGKWFL